ncbi:MAG: DsbE family thiol:disulfide interchange protein [Pseudomonadota bacterium]
MSENSETAEAPAPGLKHRLLVALPLVLFAGVAIVFYYMLFAGTGSKIPSALIGKPVPEFKLPALEGLKADGEPVKGFQSGTLYGAKVSLVNVWASWCAPCREEHPYLMELSKRPDIQVMGLNYKDKAQNARRFLGTHGNPYARVGVDPKGRAAVDWGVYGVPETFVVDKKGRIRYKYVGPITQSVLKKLLPQIEAAKLDLVK